MRINVHDYFMGVAMVVSLRSTCIRRNVGCVLVNGHNHIVATGHNGVPRNMVHCIDSPCRGANMGTGMGLDRCMAVHAESNALMQCHDVLAVRKAYCTAKPCVHCMKMLMNTGLELLVYMDDYPGELDFVPRFSIIQHTPSIRINRDVATPVIA